LVALPVCAAVSALLPWYQFGFAATLSIFGLIFSTATLLWIFAFTEIDAQGRHSGFPSRMFTLPIRTFWLVSLPILYGIVCLLFVYLAWTVVVFPRLEETDPRLWIPINALLLVALMISIQAAVWTLHRFPFIRGAAVFTIVSIFVVLFVRVVILSSHPLGWLRFETFAFSLIPLLLVAYAGALLGVHRDRSGQRQWWIKSIWGRMPELLPGRREPFFSSEHAQSWFERQRKVWLIAFSMAIPMSFTLFFFPLADVIVFTPGTAGTAFLILPVVALIAASMAGIGLAKTEYWSRDVSLHPFTAVRPITTGSLTVAKMKVAAVTALLAWGG